MSQTSKIDFEFFFPIFLNRCNQVAYLAPSIRAMYFALIEDKVIVGCYCELHMTTIVPNKNKYLEVDFLFSTFLTQSTFVNPLRMFCSPF